MENNDCKVIAILNEKGGVGKTTTTVTLGASLAMKGRKVLLIDLDPQCSLSMTFGIDDAEVSINDALTNPNANVTRIMVRDNLHLIPANIYLSSADMHLAGMMAREWVLSKFLQKFRNEYDYILLDCPPYLGVLTVNALVACDKLIVPVCAETLCIKGMRVLEETVKGVNEIKPTEISGVLVTKYDNRRSLNRNLKFALEHEYGDKVFKTVIRENTDIAKAPTFKKVIFEYNPDASGTEDYLKFTEEFIEKFEKHQ